MSANLEITDSGIVSPTTQEIKEVIQSIFLNAFGTDLNLDDSTPQGVLIDDLTQLKQAANSSLLYLANQFNPETASGVFQDALANLYFIQRKSATHSIVTCRCIGVNGTTLNGLSTGNPALAQSTNGDIFECVVGGIIGNPITDGQGNITYTTPGYIDLVFRAREFGPIPCGANTVNSIFSVINGWDSINNTSSGTVGLDEENRANFEKRRLDSLALQATGSLAAVQAGIANIDGVDDYKLWENVTGSSVTTKGVTLKPHSIWICINGDASADDIAKVIYDNKSAGCDTNGQQDCTYTDSITGVDYEYHYDYSTNIDTYIKVIVQAALPVETELAIKQAIWDNFNGEDGSVAITIGDDVYAGRFFKPLSNFDANIIQIQVSKSSDSGYENYLTYNMNQLPVVGDRPTSSAAGTHIIVEVAS